MSESSEANAFEGVTLHGIAELVRAIQASSLRSAQRIERTYSRRARGFEAVLTFCRDLGIVRLEADVLDLDTDVPKASDAAEFSDFVLKRVLRGMNSYRAEIHEFLRRFALHNGEVSYASPVPRRAAERASRNFLMEMGLVSYRSDRREHILASDYVWVYAAACESTGQTTPEALREILMARDELGHAAEIAVMEYEKQRVGTQLAGEVRHIARKNVGAGYDIRSVTVDGKARVLPRYIEVKAVSSDSYAFYWSRGEINVAKTFRQHYHLYLLPLARFGGFDLVRLKMVADPYLAVLGSGSPWTVESDVVRCYLGSSEAG